VKPNYEIMKEYKPDSYKKSPVPKITHTRSDSSNKRYTRDQYQAEQNKLEEMWDHMGLYDGKVRLFYIILIILVSKRFINSPVSFQFP